MRSLVKMRDCDVTTTLATPQYNTNDTKANETFLLIAGRLNDTLWKERREEVKSENRKTSWLVSRATLMFYEYANRIGSESG